MIVCVASVVCCLCIGFIAVNVFDCVCCLVGWLPAFVCAVAWCIVVFLFVLLVLINVLACLFV